MLVSDCTARGGPIAAEGQSSTSGGLSDCLWGQPTPDLSQQERSYYLYAYINVCVCVYISLSSRKTKGSIDEWEGAE